MMRSILLPLFAMLLAFSATAQGLPLPYYTGFDSPAEKAGWQQFRLGVTNAFDWNDNGALTHDYNVGGNPTDTVIDWYVSPALHFAYPGAISFKIITGGFSVPIPDNCEVWFGTDDPNPATGNFTLLANLSYMQPQYQWNDTTVAVPFTAQNGYIAFRYKTIGAAWMTYGIDSITVSEAVSVEEVFKQESNHVSVFPNPFSSEATLQFDYEVNDVEVSIFASNGSLVMNTSSFTGAAMKLECSNFESGLYFVNVRRGNQLVAVTKFLIE